MFLRTWGSLGSSPGEFEMPCGVALRHDEVLVVDQNNDRVQVFRLACGTFVHAWGSAGVRHGQLRGPSGVAVTGGGQVLVA